jgi:hypothetical protein
MFRLLLLVAALAPSFCWGVDIRLATLSDPGGDDKGIGTLTYPVGGELRPGDLDLRSLEISRSETGFTFVATFSNPIREKWWLPAEGREPASLAGNSALPFNLNLDLVHRYRPQKRFWISVYIARSESPHRFPLRLGTGDCAVAAGQCNACAFAGDIDEELSRSSCG